MKKYVFFQYPSYTGAQWPTVQYLIPQPPMPIEDSYQLQGHMAPQFKNDGQPTRSISLMMPSADPSVQYTNLIPQVCILPLIFVLLQKCSW